MRIVREEASLASELERAASESKRNFGDARLLLEKYVDEGKHIEVQIFGDKHGHVYSFFERECSVQRRHQKIIEVRCLSLLLFCDEADCDSAGRNARLRRCLRIRESASPPLLARSASCFTMRAPERSSSSLYVPSPLLVQTSLMHPAGRSHGRVFLPRSQHASSSRAPHHRDDDGIGPRRASALRRWRWRPLALARGHRRQADGAFASLVPVRGKLIKLASQGHAIEARLCAEDAFAEFAPRTGVIRLVVEGMQGAEGIRSDTGVQTGNEVTVFFGPYFSSLRSSNL